MYLVIYLIIVNLLAFALYAYDKRCAINSAWRVSENSLILIGIAGGSLGAFLGMHILHHKTLHNKFLITIPLLLTAHIILLILNL